MHTKQLTKLVLCILIFGILKSRQVGDRFRPHLQLRVFVNNIILSNNTFCYRQWVWLGGYRWKPTTKRILQSHWGLWQCLQLHRPCTIII